MCSGEGLRALITLSCWGEPHECSFGWMFHAKSSEVILKGLNVKNLTDLTDWFSSDSGLGPPS